MIKNLLKNKYFYILLLVVVALLSYLPFYISDGFIGDFGDPIGQTVPNKFLLIEYIKNGIFPLWNPFSFLGFPFLADIQTGVFYLPDIIIFSVFSPLIAHNISVLFHLLFAAIGIFLFIKKISKSDFIAFSLSLMMILTGSYLSRIVYLNFLETITFIPWILLISQYKHISTPLLAIVIALMIFAGHPIALFYSIMIVFTFFLFNHLSKWKKLVPAVILGFLIAAVQIIPFIFLKGQSVRDKLTYSQFTEGSLELKKLFSFINPFGTTTPNSFDTYIYFGTFAFLCLLGSIFFVKKFNNKMRNIYLTGIFLFTLGILLSLGENFSPLAKTLYELPIFNYIRVPARYIVISHFGALFSLIVFFAYLIRKNKKTAITLLTLITLNAFITPFFFLERHEISAAEKHYIPTLKNIIESHEKQSLSLKTIPAYFLSSSAFIFPNRHVLNLMPNIIGYNPMMLSKYYEFLPVSPVGAFENQNYFIDYYDKYELIGLKYYIFPTNNYLNKNNWGEKPQITNLLIDKRWEKTDVLDDEIELWKNPAPKPFAYFLDKNSTINSVNFQPGKISLKVNITKNDKLIVNQAFISGWTMNSNINKNQQPEIFQNIVQSYNIDKGTTEITIKYSPQEFYYGLYLTLLGLLLTFIVQLREQKKKTK
jgi:hypothetical protein